jgi:hypothetical protein
MNLSGIIAISGKPGLFKVVAQGKNSIIVQSLLDNKKMPAYSSDRISALDDISIYTYDEDQPLKEVFKAIHKKENGGETISHKEDASKLQNYLLEILPNFDQERVYPSDIKKIFQWYETEEEQKEEEKSTEKKPKATAEKKPTKAKAPAKPKADGGAKAKPAAAKKTTATKTGSSRGK